MSTGNTANRTHRGWWARFRVTVRMARRQARHTLRSSVLVALMVALPVGALSAGAILMDSSQPTTAQTLAVQLGQNQGFVQTVVGARNSSLRQHPLEPDWWGHTHADTSGSFTPPSDPTTTLPSGTKAIPVSHAFPVRVATEGGIGGMNLIVGDVWQPSFAGRFDVVEGRAPQNGAEIMATRGALERLGASLGDRVTLIEPAFAPTVVGVIDFAAAADAREFLFAPWSQARTFGVDAQHARWYLPELSLSWEQIQRDLNPRGVTALSRAVVLDPPPIDPEMFGAPSYWQRLGPPLMILGAGAVFAAYQVLLLAGAAFAVSSRRQRQALATAASVGAAPAEVRRIVLLQGTVLGLVGGLLGLGLGAVAAWVFLRLADTGDRTQFWGYNVPWWLLAAILAFAVTIGTLSALAPAKGAGSAEVLAALRGARKPQPLSRRRPAWGSVLLVVGLGLTVVGAFAALAMSQTGGDALPWDSPLRWLPPIAIIIGPLLVQIGVILAGAWILHLLSGTFSRLGLGARLASRDAAANSSRSVPAFASIAAAVFVAVFAVNMVGASFASNERNHLYMAPYGGAYSEVWADTAEGRVTDAEMLSREFLGIGATGVATVQWPYAQNPPNEERRDDLLLPLAVLPVSALCTMLDPAAVDACLAERRNHYGDVGVVDPDDLETVLGTALPAVTVRAFAAGSALTSDPFLIEGGRVEIGFWRNAELWQMIEGEDRVVGPTAFDQDRTHAVSWTTIPAIAVDLPTMRRYPILMAPATAARLGIVTLPATVIATFDEPPSARAIDAINQFSMSGSATASGGAFWVSVERGPDNPLPWYLLVLGVAGILVLGASAVSIGLARFDGRADDATLAAVGGTRGIRRSISFWQAIVIAGIGAWCGALTGILPSWGFVQASYGLRVTDFPWLLIAGIAVGLPLLVAASAWLISPRPAVLTRRTAIA